MAIKNLTDLRISETAEVLALPKNPQESRRLRALGLREHSQVELIHRAPFGGSLVVLVNEHIRIAVNKTTAREIRVTTA